MRRTRSWPLGRPAHGPEPWVGRVQHEWWHPGRSIRFVRRHNHVLLVVLAGRGRLRTGDTLADLGPGSLCSLIPEVPHAVESSFTEPLEILRLVLDGGDPSFWLRAHTGSPSAAWLPREAEAVRDSAQRIEAEARGGRAEAAALAAHHLAILGLLLRRGLSGAGNVDNLAERARARIAREPRRPPSLEDLASDCGVSPEHLCRRFSAAFGEPPLRYAQGLRRREAEDLLADADRPLADIARSLGFADAFAFSKAFRRWTGEAPSRWRKARSRSDR